MSTALSNILVLIAFLACIVLMDGWPRNEMKSNGLTKSQERVNKDRPPQRTSASSSSLKSTSAVSQRTGYNMDLFNVTLL